MTMVTPPQVDERLEKVGTVIIDFDTFKKTLKRSYLREERDRWGRSYMLRLMPPFKSEMEAEYYEKQQGVHYDSNWNEKPFHIPPAILILEGKNGGFNNIVNWPTKSSVRFNLTEEQIEEDGGIEESLKIGREIFWGELKTVLPESFDLGKIHGINTYTVDIVWEGVDQ